MGFQFSRTGNIGGRKKIGLDRPPALSNPSFWLANYNNVESIDSVYKMNNQGSLLSSFDSPSDQPYGISIDSSESIWIVEPNTMYKLSRDGSLISSVYPNTYIGFLRGIGINSSDSLWVVETTYNTADRLTTSGSLVNSFDVIPNYGFYYGSPIGSGVDSNDSIWVSYYGDDYADSSVFKFDSSGTQLNAFNIPSTYPNGLGVDPTGSIWFRETINNNLYKYSYNGSLISSISVPSQIRDGGMETDPPGPFA